MDSPGFGEYLSDHMFSMEYRGGAWQDARIISYDDFSCPPAMAVFHYGQTVFEGMKAFRGSDGEVRIFRPLDHFHRLNRSCSRMCIPEIDPDFLAAALRKLIKLDIDWVPSKEGNALYIRPLVIATDAYLGVRPSQTYRLFIMTSPVGAYYKEGINPVSLTTEDEYIRAAKGGSGFAKTACNYGPSLLPAQQAQKKGFTQVLWLDAKDHHFIEEVGTMNIFFKIDGKLITPPLGGSILGGITRDSVIHLAKEQGVTVEERLISIDEVFEAGQNGSLEEIFGTGTAAVISPVGSIQHQSKTVTTDDEKIGPFAEELYHTITDIQYGRREDPFGWTRLLK
jgi:branched-chain amino acid aminotransferase